MSKIDLEKICRLKGIGCDSMGNIDELFKSQNLEWT